MKTWIRSLTAFSSTLICRTFCALDHPELHKDSLTIRSEGEACRVHFNQYIHTEQVLWPANNLYINSMACPAHEFLTCQYDIAFSFQSLWQSWPIFVLEEIILSFRTLSHLVSWLYLTRPPPFRLPHLLFWGGVVAHLADDSLIYPWLLQLSGEKVS